VGELFGGVERHVLGMCTYLKRRMGVSPVLVLFHDRELAAQARGMGLSPIVLSARHRYDPALAQQLARVARAEHLDVVHAHGYKAVIASALAQVRLAASRPFQARGTYRGFAIIKTEHGRAEPAGGRPVAWIKSRTNRALELGATRRSVSAVAYVTADIAHHYERAHCGLRRQVVYNGIEPLEPARYPRPADLEGGLVHLGIVGRLTEVKGIPVALQALASPNVPTTVRLTIIGTGPQESALRGQVCAQGLGDRVRFIGFRNDVYRYLAHLDALLMPSLQEGLPYTLLEAMSLGIPVVGSRVGGLAEVLRHNETGLLVDVGDVRGLRDAIIRIVSQPAVAREIGAAGAVMQRQRYTLVTMGDSYWNLYRTAAMRIPSDVVDEH